MALKKINHTVNEPNPWKGLNFYKEGEILYGRDDEIQSLSLYVINNIQTVLYGKSGIGKSSIINAGVFPIARKEGLYPIPIRLKHDQETSYIEQIKEAFKDSKIGVREILPAIADETESLWEYLHRHIFYDPKSVEPVRPLIVFDQFEELFTLQHDENKKKAFFVELADLLNEVTPQYIINANNEANRNKEEQFVSEKYGFVLDLGFSDKEETAEYVPESLFNIVFTIREDYLFYLERYSKYIPVMKSNRYALLPLNEEQAKDIIMKPVPGLVDISVAKLIIEKVTGKTDFTLGDEPEIDVDAAILSLYLSRLYIKKGNENKEITAELVDQSSKDIIKDFYEESVSGLPEHEIIKMEEQLLTYDGRRNNVSKNDLIREGVSKKTINTLVEDRKLLRQFSYQEDIRVEFMHDILCQTVIDREKQREIAKQQEEERKEQEMRQQMLLEEEKRKRKLLEEKTAAERKRIEEENLRIENEKRTNLRIKHRNRIFALLLFIISIVLFSIAFLIYSQKKELSILNEEIRSILPSVIEQKISDGDTYTAGTLMPRLFPDRLYVEGDPLSISLLRKMSASQAICLTGHTQSVNAATFNQDCSMAITGSDDMTLKLWDSSTGHLLLSTNVCESPIVSLALSPNDKRLIVSTKNGSLKLLSITKDSLIICDSLKISNSYARYVRFDPKGLNILACCIDGRLIICNSQKLSECKTIKCANQGITYISYDREGRFMALAGSDKTIRIWDAKQLTEVDAPFVGHTDWVRSSEFSPDGKTLLSSSDDQTIRKWNLKTHSSEVVAQLPSWGTKAMFSRDGKRIVVSSKDGILRVYDTESNSEIPGFQIKHSGDLRQFNFSADGKKVITCSTDAIVHIWDLGSPMATSLSYKLQGSVYGLSHIKEKQNSDGLFVAATNEGELSLMNAKTKDILYRKSVGIKEQGQITSLSVSPDGKLIALCTKFIVRLFDRKTGNEIVLDNKNGHNGWVRNVCFSHDGKTLASVGDDGYIILWDIVNKRIHKKIRGHSQGVYCVDFSKNDSIIVTGSEDCTIRQWRVSTGEPVGDPIKGHNNVVLAVHYNNDGTRILSSSSDKTACLWTVDGELIRQFIGASGNINEAIFGLTEDEIITASTIDRCIRIWCVADGKETAKLIGHLGGVTRLDLSDDGTLVSSDNLGEVLVWKIPSLETFGHKLFMKYKDVKE